MLACTGQTEIPAESTRALVLELVEGPTLADRVPMGPNVRPGGFMPKAIRLATGVTIAALLILLRVLST